MQFQTIDEINLETTVEDLCKVLPNPTSEKEYLCRHRLEYIGELPKSISKTHPYNLFYLGGEVSALTTRSYLEKIDNRLTLADLFTLEGDEFYPINPNYAERES
ncbi:MAG TPA: hypothetical protein VJK51_02640 [Candidatus Nanoarchaeia archaeon]|nr:hypothetical protein [Candidatus Nanoarchaeia archaeon]